MLQLHPSEWVKFKFSAENPLLINTKNFEKYLKSQLFYFLIFKH
jgi:hypothetical protein